MKILVVAGASGGHIYPAAAFLEKLQEKRASAEALLVLPSRSISVNLSSIKYRIVFIPSSRVFFSLSYKSIASLILFFRGAWQGLLILLKFKPDLVLGFGSLDSVPLVMMAWFFRIKTLIHEQNVLPGRANKLLSKFSDKVAISFLDSRCYFGLSNDKVSFTGNPLRSSLKRKDKRQSLNALGLDEGKFTVLVMGGSQGSTRLNEVFLNTVELISDKEGFQVVHILGKKESLQHFQDKYKSLRIKACVFQFCNEMDLVYSCADLAVTRAGATTISELVYFDIPAVLVPYPFAYAHQFYNAKVIENVCAGIIIKDEKLSPGLLRGIIEGYISRPELLAAKRNNYKSIFKDDPAQSLLRISESLISVN